MRHWSLARPLPCSSFMSSSASDDLYAMYPGDVILKDGSTVFVRPVRTGDAEALRRLLDGLSGRSSYQRFFTIQRSSELEVHRLITGDGVSSVALVAESGGDLVGVANYVRLPDRPAHAEVAFAVADETQGHGVGTRLLGTLAAMAREAGIRWFHADVLGDNHQMLPVFRGAGFNVEIAPDALVSHVTLDLNTTPEVEARSAAHAVTAVAASMQPFFHPRGVVVVGASQKRGKIGAEILHNLISCGFAGPLFAVHPSATEIQGVPAAPRVTALPKPVDLAVICVPAQNALAVVNDCIAGGVRGIVMITAGFAETGALGRLLEADILTAVRRAGIRMIGPNCMGVLNTDPAVQLNATFASVFPPHGRVAMLSQSGALGIAILEHARQLQIGLSTFVSVGNKADVSGNDLLLYWEQDAGTDVILLYLESFGNPRKFSQIARRVGRRKPIVAVKAGRSRVGARAATSHTGALATSDAVVDALFHQCGVIRTDTMEELFDVTRVLSQQPVPAGRRVAIVTNGGGPGILAADACQARGLEVAALSAATRETLRGLLSPAASVSNPVDMIASATPDQYERSLAAVLDDENIDSVVAIFVSPMVTNAEDVARALKRTAATVPHKPVLAVFMGSESAADALGPIPSFVFPEAAAAALARAARYGEWRTQPEGCVPAFADFNTAAAQTTVRSALEFGAGWARPSDAQALLAAAGIASARMLEAQDAEACARAADGIGYPVALKAFGPSIVHKTELGAIRLNLQDADAVRAAFRSLQRSLGTAMHGAMVQEMVGDGVEMLVGVVEDPAFGPVVACSPGGTSAELFADHTFGLTPLTDIHAQSMIDGLRFAPLLRGYRGAPVVDEIGLRDTLLRLSMLATLCPEIQEIEINPLQVLPDGVKALDVRVRIDRPQPKPRSRRIQY
jgi:acetyl coenzyme A synthetase (ADP forming)-like protein